MTARYGDRSRVTTPVGSWGKAGGIELAEISATFSPSPAATVIPLIVGGVEHVRAQITANTSVTFSDAPATATVEYATVAGGGGGAGGRTGAGGGGVIYRKVTISSIASASPIVIGGGGAPGSNGANSSFLTDTVGGGTPGASGNGFPGGTHSQGTTIPVFVQAGGGGGGAAGRGGHGALRIPNATFGGNGGAGMRLYFTNDPVGTPLVVGGGGAGFPGGVAGEGGGGAQSTNGGINTGGGGGALNSTGGSGVAHFFWQRFQA